MLFCIRVAFFLFLGDLFSCKSVSYAPIIVSMKPWGKSLYKENPKPDNIKQFAPETTVTLATDAAC